MQVTERKEAEIRSRGKKKAAEAADRSKGEFPADMSHEIRTPLNAITGLVELVLETDLTPQQREDLEVVMAASYSLLSVINDIPDSSNQRTPGKPPVPIKKTTTRPLRILAAEDNPFNQKFMLRLLGRCGHQVTIAENGRQALEMSVNSEFDLILMDVQMPEMNGLDATREIRNRETQTGRRIPIIAVTALAMKGDRERCLDAGMDGYVSKPVDIKMLLKTIQSFFPEAGKSTIHNVPEADIQARPDTKSLLNIFNNDMDFLKQMAEMFLSDAPPLLNQIQNAIESENADILMRTAHSLKGMLKNFNFMIAAQKAFELEEMGRQKEFDNSRPAFENLAGQLDSAINLLKDVIK